MRNLKPHKIKSLAAVNRMAITGSGGVLVEPRIVLTAITKLQHYKNVYSVNLYNISAVAYKYILPRGNWAKYK